MRSRRSCKGSPGDERDARDARIQRRPSPTRASSPWRCHACCSCSASTAGSRSSNWQPSRRGRSTSRISPSPLGSTHPSIYGGVDRKRFIIETNGAGVALVDYDRDGWLDALVLSGTQLADGERRDASFPSGEAPSNRMYRNQRDGTFIDVTDRVGLRRTGWASGVCAGDVDRDGWLDLFITYYGRNVLYRNDRGVKFQDVTAAAGLRGQRRAMGFRLHVYRLRPRWPSRFVRLQLPALRSRRSARAGEGTELPVEGRARELRSEGAADRHQPPLS